MQKPLILLTATALIAGPRRHHRTNAQECQLHERTFRQCPAEAATHRGVGSMINERDVN